MLDFLKNTSYTELIYDTPTKISRSQDFDQHWAEEMSRRRTEDEEARAILEEWEAERVKELLDKYCLETLDIGDEGNDVSPTESIDGAIPDSIASARLRLLKNHFAQRKSRKINADDVDILLGSGSHFG